MSQPSAARLLSNPNVRLTFAYRVSAAITQGLWNLGVGSTYVFLLEHGSNTVMTDVNNSSMGTHQHWLQVYSAKSCSAEGGHCPVHTGNNPCPVCSAR